jgi:NitT/TauT family transport system ATP-binding protein
VTEAKIRVEGLAKRFVASEGARTEAIASIDLDVDRGEFVTIVGPSGCGKTTLVRICAGLETPTSGAVHLVHDDPGATLVSIVLQDHALFPWLSAAANVAYGIPRPVPRRVRLERGRELLAAVGLAPFADTRPHELSAGMRCRVSLARALASDPEILLMDEPFAALDAQTRLRLQQQLHQLCAGSDRSVVFVTHDLDEAVFLGDRVIVLSARPARVLADIAVPFGHDREQGQVRRSPDYWRILDQLWAILPQAAP